MARSTLVWLCLAALAGLGLVAIFCWRTVRPARAAGRAPVATAESTTESTAQLRAVDRQLSLLRAELAGLKERVYQPPPVDSALVAVQDLPPDPAAQGAIPTATTLEAAQTHLDQLFASETTDVAWARTEELNIGEFVRREAGDGSSLDALSCRSSMCRMQVRFRDDQARDAFKLKLGTPPLNNGGFYREQGDTELLYFAARAGHPLPPIPAE